jgi:hypothetical protein
VQEAEYSSPILFPVLDEMVALSALSSFYGNCAEAEPVAGRLANTAAMDYCSQRFRIQPKKSAHFCSGKLQSLLRPADVDDGTCIQDLGVFIRGK